MDTIDISTLQDPQDCLQEHGEYALFGLYMRVYWESLEIGDSMLEIKTLAPNQPRVDKLFAKLQNYENWLGLARERLPEYAITILAEIDAVLEGDGL
jgi:hypothetical protein